jgi:hypothetical protein
MARITAERIEAIEGLPAAAEWNQSESISFCADWRGENPDPLTTTEVKILWSPDHLFIRFRCNYRELYTYAGGNCLRDELWLRDVAELFIRPEDDNLRHYKEFEISPNGDWLDLDINNGKKTFLSCNLKSQVTVNPSTMIWTAEMGIPFSCLDASFDPRKIWRLNLFRIEGPEPNRFYSAWRPTGAPKPNFHVPDVFGELQLK